MWDLWTSSALTGRITSVTRAATKTVTTAVTRTVTTDRAPNHQANQFEPSTDPCRSERFGRGLADLGAVTEFRLYDGATARSLGRYGTPEAAFAAADEHSLEFLAEAGEWVTVEHLFAWVDVTGRIHLVSELTHVGPPDDLEGCRDWLRRLPGRRPHAPHE